MFDQRNVSATSTQQPSLIATNAVLRNTYLLLGLSIFFSGITAYVAMVTNAPFINPFLLLIGYFGLLFLTSALRNSVWGLGAVFLLTGFMGYTLGPLLNAYLAAYVNGAQLIMTALGGTGLIFFGLSGYVLITQKDFSFLTGFIMVGAMVGLIAVIASLFFQVPAFSLAISGFFMVLSSLIILWQTSAIIHGGERNYIMATVTLYVQLFNLFVSLLNILGHFAGDRN